MISVENIIEDAYVGFKEFYGFDETNVSVYVQSTPIISIDGHDEPISVKIFEDCAIIEELSYDIAARMFPMKAIRQKSNMLLVEGTYKEIIERLKKYSRSKDLDVAVGCLGEYNIEEDLDDIIDILSISVFGDYTGDVIISADEFDFDMLMM